jgi:hypothetical protein
VARARFDGRFRNGLNLLWASTSPNPEIDREKHHKEVGILLQIESPVLNREKEEGKARAEDSKITFLAMKEGLIDYVENFTPIVKHCADKGCNYYSWMGV